MTNGFAVLAGIHVALSAGIIFSGPSAASAQSGRPDAAVRLAPTLYDAHKMTVSALAFSSDRKLLVSGSADRTAAVWDVSSGKRIVELQEMPGTIRQAAIRPDNGTILFAIGPDNKSATDGVDFLKSCHWSGVAFDTKSAKSLGRVDTGDFVLALAYSTAGAPLTARASGDDRPIVFWDIGEEKLPGIHP